jgi:hypothetical protein
MRTKLEILLDLHKLIPAELFEKYDHLTFEEMAKQRELKQWRGDLIQAERIGKRPCGG